MKDCRLCGQPPPFRPVWTKQSKLGDDYQIVECPKCRLRFVDPLPDQAELDRYYGDDYFQKRTERGYDNYYSEAVRAEVERVFRLNLHDAGFYNWYEKQKKNKPGAPLRHLDVGCAAGYFVAFTQNGLGFDSTGIEISADIAAFGRNKLDLNIITGDFLRHKAEGYDFITLWASIEHMRRPDLVFEKVSELLNPGGLFILSTCHYSWAAKSRGTRWRYLNVPEHLYYFRRRNLREFGRRFGLKPGTSFTYGSGFTAKKDMNAGYRTAKAVADRAVKVFGWGDMIVAGFHKP